MNLKCKSHEELRDMNRLVVTERRYGMEINIDKSQVMGVPGVTNNYSLK